MQRLQPNRYPRPRENMVSRDRLRLDGHQRLDPTAKIAGDHRVTHGVRLVPR